MSPRGDAMSDEMSTAEQVLADPSTSFWLKSTVQTALDRDPVDALNDALVLAAILDARLRAAFDLQELE
jgi:hypothetical protein